MAEKKHQKTKENNQQAIHLYKFFFQQFCHYHLVYYFQYKCSFFYKNLTAYSRNYLLGMNLEKTFGVKYCSIKVSESHINIQVSQNYQNHRELQIKNHQAQHNHLMF